MKEGAEKQQRLLLSILENVKLFLLFDFVRMQKFRIYNAYVYQSKEKVESVCIEALPVDRVAKYPKKLWGSLDELQEMLGITFDRELVGLGLNGLILQVEESYSLVEEE